MTAISQDKASDRAMTMRLADSLRDSQFEALYVQHQLTVARYLRARCQDDDEALDLAASTFERALHKMVRDLDFNPGLGWLLRTARNAAIDQARRRRTRHLFDVALGREQKHAESAEAEALARDDVRAVRRAVAALPQPQSDAIALRFGADLTAGQIGELIGKSEAATQKLISRGIARLREALHEE